MYANADHHIISICNLGEDSSGKIKEIPGPEVKHISGFCFLDNHSVNLLSTIFTGLMLPSVAYSLWPLR